MVVGQTGGDKSYLAMPLFVIFMMLPEIYGNETLCHLLELLFDRRYRIRAFSQEKSGDHMLESHREHRRILAALMQRDASKAERLMAAVRKTRKRSTSGAVAEKHCGWEAVFDWHLMPQLLRVRGLMRRSE